MTVEERSISAMLALMEDVAKTMIFPTSRAFQYVVQGPLSEQSIAAFVATNDSPDGSLLLQAVARAAIREYLRELSVKIDECQQINGEVLVIGVCNPDDPSSVVFPKHSRDYFGALASALLDKSDPL